MKKLLITLIVIAAFVGGVFYVVPEYQDRKELYGITDPLVKSLETTYDSYGLFGPVKHKKTSHNYVAGPIGRLIIVNYTDYADHINYEKLEMVLKRHYKHNRTVREVFRNEGGTITIDCRR